MVQPTKIKKKKSYNSNYKGTYLVFFSSLSFRTLCLN